MDAQTPVTTHQARRTITLAFLSVLFVALVLGIVWMESGGNRNQTLATTTAQTILIKRDKFADIKMEQHEGQWEITSPYRLAANQQRIEPLLGLLSLQTSGYEQSEVDMPATGLQDPKASIVFDDLHITLGEADASGERRYALINDRVNLIPAWVWSLAHGGVTGFANLTVFKSLPEEIMLSDGSQSVRPDNQDLWLNLQADKIIDWPQGDSTYPAITVHGTDNKTPVATLQHFEQHAVIITEENFAYLISADMLDMLIAPLQLAN